MSIFSNKLLNKYLLIYNKYKNNRIFNLFLYLISIFFLVGYKIRLFLYKIKLLKSVSLPAYVISIGNISSGGTGKTPIAIEAAKHFLSYGKNVAVLARGYAGKSDNEVVLVSDGKGILVDEDICGDEPYLIAKNVPQAIVLCGKDRIRSGISAIKLGAEILILDDGYQYLKLKRNEDILIIDSYNPFDNCHLLPHGRLRELPDSMKRASALIISNSDSKEIKDKDFNFIRKYINNKPIGKFYYKLKELVSLNTKERLDLDDVKNLKAIACCGIGNPNSFLDLLQRNEIHLSTYIEYPDHHKYIYGDIQQLSIIAQKYKTENVIVTEKDAVKIKDLCQAAPLTFWSAKVEVIWQTPNIFDDIFNKLDRVQNK